MSQINISIEEGTDMDNIIKFLLTTGREPKDCTAQVLYIFTNFLKDKTEYYTVNLIYKILDHRPKILQTKEKAGIATVIWPTYITKDFLSTGGFSKIAAENALVLKFEKEKEELNFEKLKYDVKNSKRIFKTYWWTFTISIIAFILSLINVFKGCK